MTAADTIPSSSSSTITLLTDILAGSFDAGLLVDPSGAILKSNQPCRDLLMADSASISISSNDNNINTNSAEDGNGDFWRHMDDFVQFWSHSLTRKKENAEEQPEAQEMKMKKQEESKRKQQNKQESENDTLTWNQVVKYYETTHHNDAVKEWIITATKKTEAHLFPPETQTQTQPHASHPEEEKGDATIKSSVSFLSQCSMQTTVTFPGILKLTNIQGLYLVFLRHSDHHDILTAQNGSVGSPGNYGVRRRSRENASNNSKAGSRNRDLPQAPRVTIDENGNVTAVHTVPSGNNAFPWLTKDLVGKHLSHIQHRQHHQQVTEQASIPDPNNYFEIAKARENNAPKMSLDFILEHQINPGSSSLPYSGFPLRTEDFNTALTTGNAIREENITEAAFEAALDPIFQIDEHGCIQMVNSAASSIFQYTRQEFIGSNISMICGGGHDKHHAAYMSRYLATGDTRVIGKNRKLMARKKDQSEFPIELGVVEVDTFAGDTRLFCGFVRDLTDLQARERLAQEIVEVALDPMFQINQEGVIVMVNKATLTAFGYEREELVGANISIICGGSHGNNHDIYLHRYLKTGQANVIGKYRELPAKRKDGSEFWIQLAVVEIQSNSKQRMFCGFIHDLSKQRRFNELMKGTIDTSLDPVLHINENGIIQMVNTAACHLLGYTKDEMLGENVSLIVGGIHQANHGQYIERYLETGEKRAMGKKRKLTARRKDGSEMKIELGLSEIIVSGTNERVFCAFLTNLTSREESSSIHGDEEEEEFIGERTEQEEQEEEGAGADNNHEVV